MCKEPPEEIHISSIVDYATMGPYSILQGHGGPGELCTGVTFDLSLSSWPVYGLALL